MLLFFFVKVEGQEEKRIYMKFNVVKWIEMLYFEASAGGINGS
jgi:hypothetical protein